MRIDAVDFFYLSMPAVTNDGDGSQDALLVRVRAGEHTGWGECEASPLVSIAAFVCPMSHGACRPVAASVLGEFVDGPEDIARIAAAVSYNSMDLLQAAHTFSGVEIALWDLSEKRAGNRPGDCSAIGGRSQKFPTLPSCSAKRRRRHWNSPAPPGRSGSGPSSSAGGRSAEVRYQQMRSGERGARRRWQGGHPAHR